MLPCPAQPRSSRTTKASVAFLRLVWGLVASWDAMPLPFAPLCYFRRLYINICDTEVSSRKATFVIQYRRLCRRDKVTGCSECRAPCMRAPSRSTIFCARLGFTLHELLLCH